MTNTKDAQSPNGRRRARRSASVEETGDQLLRFGAMGKAFSILETLTGNPHPLSMAELARETGMTKPTAHRIISVLAELGFVERDQGKRGYVEGSRLIQFSLDALKATAQRNIRHSILRALSDETNETCNFGILTGAEVIYLDRVEAKRALGLRFEPGVPVPAHCSAIGKLMLALEPPERRDELLRAMPLTRFTPSTITSVSALLEVLERVREVQIGIDDQESIEGVVCVAVPVRAEDGNVVGGLAVSAPEARVSMDDALRMVPQLRKAATKLGKTFSLGPTP
ncbi:MAG: IclR family transcriptional regulator [Hyphomicrobiaceae bacterium]|nr:IclR family transcriptional regulator [Hyphomicrobiaceae bacterium]